MGFGLNAAMMSGVNDGIRQIKTDEFLDQSRQREAKTSDLNQQVLSGQVEDLTRARGDQAAYRGAGATAAAANPGDKLMPLSAQRDEALKRGDTDTANRIDASIKQMHQEGLVDLTRFAMMQSGPFQPGSPQAMEASRIFNSTGQHRVAPGAVALDADGNIHTITADGRQAPVLSVQKLAILTGLVKPDEYATAGDGQVFNKRTGVVSGDRVLKPGEVVAKSGGGFGAQAPFAPKDSALVVPEDSKVVPLGAGGVPGAPVSVTNAPVPTKIRKEVSDEVDSGYKGPLGELTGTSQVRDAAKNYANLLFESNQAAGKRMTPQLAAQIGRQMAEGTLQPVEAVDSAGAKWRAVQFGGNTFNLDPYPSTPAPTPAAKPNTAVPQAAIDMLKSKSSDPAVLAQFKAKYGIDPQTYLGAAPKPAAKASAGPGEMIGATEAAARGIGAPAAPAVASSTTEDPEPIRYRGRAETKEWKAWKARQDEAGATSTRSRMQRNADALKNRSFGVIQP